MQLPTALSTDVDNKTQDGHAPPPRARQYSTCLVAGLQLLHGRPLGRRIQQARQAVILRLHNWRCTDEMPLHGRCGDSAVGGITPCQAGKWKPGQVQGNPLPEFLAFWRELFRVLSGAVCGRRGRLSHGSCSAAGSLQNGRDARSLARPQGRVGRRRPWPGVAVSPHRAPYPGCPIRDPE